VATVPLEKDAMEGPFPLEDLALEDATGNNVGTVSAEIPVGPKWCEIWQTIFNWTTQKFPFGVKTAHALTARRIEQSPACLVTSQSFSIARFIQPRSKRILGAASSAVISVQRAED
jgi:hypothetical protein